MATSGLLGKTTTLAGTSMQAYIVPANVVSATININVVNAGSETAAVTISVSSSWPPAKGDSIEYGYSLIPGGVLERSGIVVSPSERVGILSDKADVVVRIHGFEEV